MKTFPNESWGDSTPLDLPYKKYQREFPKLKCNMIISNMRTYESVKLTCNGNYIVKSRIL